MTRRIKDPSEVCGHKLKVESVNMVMSFSSSHFQLLGCSHELG